MSPRVTARVVLAMLGWMRPEACSSSAIVSGKCLPRPPGRRNDTAIVGSAAATFQSSRYALPPATVRLMVTEAAFRVRPSGP